MRSQKRKEKGKMKTFVLTSILVAGLGILACVLAHDAGSQTDLVGYWRFDEGQGTIAYDSSDCGNNGSFVRGVGWTENGKYDNALYFDGTPESSGITIPHSDSLNITGDITVEAWFMLEKGDQHGNIVTKWEGTGIRSWILDITSGKLRFGVTSDGTSIVGVYSRALEYGKWYHAAATHVLGKNINLYLDDALEANMPYTEGIHEGDSNISIGRYGITGTFEDIIDEVRIYNSALDEYELARHSELLIHTKVDYSLWPEQDPRIVITPLYEDLDDYYNLRINISKDGSIIYHNEMEDFPSDSFELSIGLPEDVSLLKNRKIKQEFFHLAYFCFKTTSVMSSYTSCAPMCCRTSAMTASLMASADCDRCRLTTSHSRSKPYCSASVFSASVMPSV